MEKVKLFKMGMKMTSGMSPNTLEKTAKELVKSEGLPADQKSGTAAVGSDGKTPSAGTAPVQATAAGTSANAAPSSPAGMNVSQSGPQLTQAEVESGMKVVRIHTCNFHWTKIFHTFVTEDPDITRQVCNLLAILLKMNLCIVINS